MHSWIALSRTKQGQSGSSASRPAKNVGRQVPGRGVEPRPDRFQVADLPPMEQAWRIVQHPLAPDLTDVIEVAEAPKRRADLAE